MTAASNSHPATAIAKPDGRQLEVANPEESGKIVRTTTGWRPDARLVNCIADANSDVTDDNSGENLHCCCRFRPNLSLSSFLVGVVSLSRFLVVRVSNAWPIPGPRMLSSATSM